MTVLGMTSKAVPPVDLQQEAIFQAHSRRFPFQSIRDLSGYLQKRAIPRPETTDSRRPSKREQFDLSLDEIFLYRGHDDRLSPFKLEQCGNEENSISREVAARLRLDDSVNSTHGLYWYRPTAMAVQYSTFRVREMDHQVLLGKDCHDWHRLSYLPPLSTSSGNSAGFLTPGPSSPQESIAPRFISCDMMRNSWAGGPGYASINPTNTGLWHDSHDMTGNTEIPPSLKVSLESPTESGSVEEPTSRALIRLPIVRSPASAPPHHAGSLAVVPSSPMPREVAVARPEVKTRWLTPPRNVSLAEYRRPSSSRHSENFDGDGDTQFDGEDDATVRQPSVRQRSRESRGPGSRTPSTSTYPRRSRSHERGRSGGRGNGTYTGSMASDERSNSRQDRPRRGGRRRVGDKVASYLGYATFGALFMLGASR